MKIQSSFLSPLILCAFAFSLRAEEPPKRVTITGNDTMKYSITTIEVSPGQQVIVELKNEGSMPKDAMGHNWILLKAGVDAVAYADAAASAKAEGYQPKSQAGKVLASIRLLGPQEKGLTSFKAPVAPGNYEFLCSFPAHTQAGMRGTLMVK